MTDDRLQQANDDAARAARAWLLAVGLANEVNELRFGDVDPIPAPGLDALVARADHFSRKASAAADLAPLLAAAGDEEVRLAMELLRAEYGADEAERTARRVAEVALGVAAQLSACDRVYRLDRAAVAVLAPPAGHGPRSPFCADGVELVGTGRAEHLVEMAGLLSRLLVDRGMALLFTASDDGEAEVTVYVDPCDTLIVSSETDERRWPSPVTVMEPAIYIVDDLLDGHVDAERIGVGPPNV